MCGICGFTGSMSSSIGKDGLTGMLNAIRHRGPDEEGIFYREGTGLGIRRLSIVDIEGGHQPLHNEDKKIHVVFNGEIYNYKALRQELLRKGHSFHTSSDTEVIVHLYEEYGEEFVSYLNGMFAIAIYDGRKNKMMLVRDRMGVKPLYYWFNNGTLVFASEVKALLTCGFIKTDVNIKVVGNYLTYRFIPGEQTMFRDIFKLMPGGILIYEKGGIRKRSYWDINPVENRRPSSQENYTANVKKLLSQSVKQRVENEASIGIFLSGGLDSTIVLSEAAKNCSNINSFSVGFERPDLSYDKTEYDEMDYSREVAKTFGTKHLEYTISSGEVIDDIEKIISYMDDPIGDPTSIPLYYVSKLAKGHSKVVLSGEGADEIFGGYSIYKEPQAINKYLSLPGFFRKDVIERILPIMPISRGKDFIKRANQSVESRYKGVGLTFRSEELRNVLNFEFSDCIADLNIDEYISSVYEKCFNMEDEDKMLYFDQKIWLPEDVLTKTDKMSMAHSIELRVPFMDYHLVEYSSGIPFNLKYKDDIEKYVLKEAFKNDIPRFVVERKKNGFPVPISALLGREFKDFAYDILLSQRCIQRGYFNAEYVKQLLNRNYGSSPYIGRQIWLLIIFELWHRVFIDGSKRNL